MTERQPIPTNWVCKSDLIHCRPDLREQIVKLEDGDMAIIADRLGEALQETYWLALDVVLSAYLEDDASS